jgi:oxygen-independent coproporphyrinogen-3 oxidase
MVQVDSRVGALYIHVPFCAQKCAYCAFYSEALQGDWIERYLTALVAEMERVAHDLAPRTIFFGGGTPSLLTLRQWERVFRAMDRFGWRNAAEWTVECNPATVSLDKARLWREAGVNRVSMGVQSFDAALLERLGRVHTRAAAFRSFDTLRRAGFDNVNVDLMFAIPGQTLEVWRRTLDEALALGSEHLSCYEVIYEEDTPLFAQLKAGRFAVDEDLACAMYEELVQRAGSAGFYQYEIANFARDTRLNGAGDRDGRPARGTDDAGSAAIGLPAFACRHNVNYWRGGDFYGLGPSATSSVRGVRTQNVSDTRRYCEALERGQRAVAFRETLSPLARAGETAAFGLRMIQGWGFDEFRRVTGFDLREEWAADMEAVSARGWGVIEPARFRLTPVGLRFADAAAEYFLR